MDKKRCEINEAIATVEHLLVALRVDRDAWEDRCAELEKRVAELEQLLRETVSELGSYQRQGMPPHITYGLFKHLAATLKGEDDGR